VRSRGAEESALFYIWLLRFLRRVANHRRTVQLCPHRCPRLGKQTERAFFLASLPLAFADLAVSENPFLGGGHTRSSTTPAARRVGTSTHGESEDDGDSSGTHVSDGGCSLGARRRTRRRRGTTPPETASSAPNHYPTTGDNDLVVAVLALSSADPTGVLRGCEGEFEPTPIVGGSQRRRRSNQEPSPRSSPSSGVPEAAEDLPRRRARGGVAGVERGGWPRDAASGANVTPTDARVTPANALAAIAAADPEGRPALTLVPYLLDITLTRAGVPPRPRAPHGGAAAGVPVPPRGRTPR
jgi:hypothetical protein